ncbi:MAG TPA: penicillin-binding protein [Candidatus Corynebacterium gallistercoris]|uniref:Penicillin-binding protein n=1 Tax=Candidatus Corynebacterium gallistercoris TaxID=2838530 RepID=A0A9D1UPH7_9CORY|nr:penicillin-binding protein [Candidatus Corynebacterium gallistercoris]
MAVGGAILAVLIIVPMVAFFTAYSVTKVPEPEELVNNQISYIMASDNETELARIVPPEGNRQNVDIADIPIHVRQAVLAAEDREFYTNPGFSITGFGRAALGQLLGKEGAGGGSTITQQYVKNALVGDEFSLTRKAKELVISAKMAREWSKDEILEAYLNTIYFGRNAYGIGSASHAYFNKPVNELTVEEGAVLAATIQAPSALDPWTNREAAEYRWNYVMDGMVQTGAIDPTLRNEAQYPEIMDPAVTATNTQVDGPNGLIKTQVIQELEAAGITEDQVNTGGLRITTTIDPATQAAAVEQSRSLKEGEQEGLLNAVVSVDPKTGGIKAWYGGEDPVGFDYANAGLQTGSTFKIMALAAYLDQGGSIYDQFDSSPVTTGGTTVTNVDNQSCGTCSIAQALKMSLNTSFIRLTRDLQGGAQDVADMAHRLGVAETLPGIGETLSENGGAPFEGITLGMYQSRPLDMASALATLSNSGMYYRPHFVEKVENSDGEVLLDNSNLEGDQVVDEAVADAVIAAMQPIAMYSNGNGLAGGRPSAAKTGTAQLGDTGQNKDAWMIGSTPQLSTAVWVGTADAQPLLNPWGGVMYGSGLPSQIWKATMDQALQNDAVEYFNTGGATTGSGSYSGSTGSGSYSGSGSGSQGAETQQEPAEEPSPEPAPAPAPQPNPQPNPQPAPAPDLGEIIDGIFNP